MSIKLGSLFDGIGGFPYSGIKFGITPVWASEIEPWPIKVTEKHFPNMKHLGDITQINGAEIEPVDIITFGSPCQDLSVAGKREGLAGERSGLFMDAVRIIRQMRTATGGKRPRFAVWENVPGAFSSNKGQDFRAVLEEIGNAEIPMPKSGRWATAGMVRTETADIAWRVLDAQYHGVPQRRRRIFLVADFGGQCAGEILFVEEGLSGDIAESGKAREEVAATVGDGVEKSGECLMFENHGQDTRFKGPLGVAQPVTATFGMGGNNQPFVVHKSSYWDGGQISDCLDCSMLAKGQMMPEKRRFPAVVLADQGGSVMSVHDDISPTLRAQEHGHQPIVMREVSRTLRAEAGAPKHEADWESLIIEPRSQDGVCRIHDDGIVPTLNTAQGGQRQPCVLAFTQNQRDEIRDLNDKAGALAAKPGMKQQTFIIQNATRGKPQNGLGISQDDVSYTLDSLGNHAICLQGSMIGRADKNGPQGDGVNEEVSFTLNTTDRHAVATVDCRNLYENKELSGTLQCKQTGGHSLDYQNPVRIGYAVRRLTPLECLRLQGFPDYWLDIEGMSDTQKYRSIGNSVAIPVVDFVLGGISEVINNGAK